MTLWRRAKARAELLLAKFGIVALAIGLAVWLVGGTLDGLWVGKAIVIDGDTLEFEGGSVDLYAVDAPEFAQTCESRGKAWGCGAYAMAALLTRVHGKSLWCFEKGRGTDGQIIAQCHVGLSDVAEELVESGWAVVTADAASRYGAEEQLAKSTHRGIWGSTFVPPAEWRLAFVR